MSNNGKSGEPLPEAPASATAKVKSPNGFTWLLTRRNSSVSALLKELETIEAYLTSNGWEPVEEPQRGGKRKSKSNYVEAPTNGTAPRCPQHQAPMKASQYGGFYCTRKDEAGNYCSYKAK